MRTLSCSLTMVWKLPVAIHLASRMLQASASQVVTPFLPQSFFFDWNKPGQPVPIPTTEQCETIHINWARSTAQGPNPTAPYFLHVYTSAYITPFIIPAGDGLSFDWAVPFAPDTLYQICMFDKFGNTGGCQATYTVIPPSTPPACANITFPPLLDVTAEVDSGPMSQYGWIDQCTDISLTPKNGTPPFILTVAPALHPPYNITSFELNKPINWTISLSWASAYFISLVDSNGSMWSNGPLHSAGGGTTACLAGNVTEPAASVKPSVAIGSGIGGIVVGLAFGFLGMYLILSRRYKQKLNSDRFVHIPSGAPGSPVQGFDYPSGSSQYRPLPTSSPGLLTLNSQPSIGAQLQRHSSNYHIEPFVMPDEHGRTQERQQQNTLYSPTGGNAATSPIAGNESVAGTSSGGPSGPSQLYVLHHDSQMPPVTIYHQSGTQIVELPPRYPPAEASRSEGEAYTHSDGLSDGSRAETGPTLSVHQHRQPGQIRKLPREP